MARPPVLSALVSVQVLFGTNFIASKQLLLVWDPLVWASVRNSIVAAVLMGVARFSGAVRPEPHPNFIAKMGFLALFGVILNQITVQVGLSLTSTANAAVLSTLTPVFTVLLASGLGQEQLTGRRLLGVSIAFLGVTGLHPLEDFHFASETVLGDVLVVMGCACYAVFLVSGRMMLSRESHPWETAWIFTLGAIGLSVLSLPNWLEKGVPYGANLSLEVYVVIAGTVIPYFLSNWILSRTSSSRVALYTYLQPPVVVGLSLLLNGELPSWRVVLSGVMIFSGFLTCGEFRTRQK